MKKEYDKKIYNLIPVSEETHKRTGIRKAELGKTFDQLLNYLLDGEKELLKLKK